MPRTLITLLFSSPLHRQGGNGVRERSKRTVDDKKFLTPRFHQKERKHGVSEQVWKDALRESLPALHHHVAKETYWWSVSDWRRLCNARFHYTPQRHANKTFWVSARNWKKTRHNRACHTPQSGTKQDILGVIERSKGNTLRPRDISLLHSSVAQDM